MRTGRRRGAIAGLALALIAVALLVPAGRAAASTQLVTFDDLAAGTTVTDQYKASRGVFFTTTGPGLAPHVDSAPAQAHSGSNVADIYTCPSCGESFPEPATRGHLTTTASGVSVWVGFLPDPGADPAQMRLTAYNTGNQVVAQSALTTVTEGQPFKQLAVTASASNIAYFDINTPGTAARPIAIDDLEIDYPGTTGPADFGIAAPAAPAEVVQGHSVQVPIDITRLNGSNGNVSFAATGLPPGVSASFAPNPVPGTGDATVLTLTAAPDAPGSDSYTDATVTATPAAGAGADPRTATVTVRPRSAFDMAVGGSPNVDLSACVVNVPLNFIREFAFTPPVSLSVSGLANGVQASFSPSQVTFPNGSRAQTVALVVTAPATGFAVPNTTLTVHATAPGLPERRATVTVHGTCPAQYDARVTSLQITQGVQSPFLPVRDPLHPPSVTTYSEVPNAAKLRGGGPTVVRVYADLAFGPSEGVPNVPAVLNGWTHNRVGSIVPLPGSPLLSTSGPRHLDAGGPEATVAEEDSETKAYTFTLPASWTHGEIGVGAQLQPSQGASPLNFQAVDRRERRSNQAVQQRAVTPCQTATCLQNDTMSLTRIPFFEAPVVTIQPIEMRTSGQALPDPASVFRWARLVTPLQLVVKPYAATIDITDLANTRTSCRNAAGMDHDAKVACDNDSNGDALDRVDDWTCDNGAPSFGWNMGVDTVVARGVTNPYNVCITELSAYKDAVVEYQRPLTSVSHEFFHLLGRPHASDCNGGGSNGQTAEDWPPDQKGYTQSIGLDTTLGSGSSGPYALASNSPGPWFDFMSYCADSSFVSNPLTSNSWGSVHNWNAVLEDKRYHRAVAPGGLAAAAPRSPSLHVHGFEQPDGSGAISSVTPVQAPPQPASQSGYHLVGQDASGKTVADVQMLAAPVHVDGQAPPIALDGVIPSAGVTSVAIVHGGASLAARRQSAHAPTVTLRGVPAFGRGRATIRWRAHDADPGALGATIGYAKDGRSFKQVWRGPSRGLARVPARYLARSARARVRVSVNDGFRVASATSRRFRSPGGPPVVKILSPVSGLHEPNDAPLVLSGQAFDDALRPLTGSRLRWLMGKRVIGHGAQVAPTGLPGGKHRIVLEARDSAGRRGRAAVTVTLRAAQPLFLKLSAPKKVSRKAHSLKLKVSSSLPARLTVRGGAGKRAQAFRVSRKLRGLKLRVPASRKKLKLRLTLAAGGRTRTARATVGRG
jgi:hypothetical protein